MRDYITRKLSTLFVLLLPLLLSLWLGGGARAQTGTLHRTSSGLLTRDDFTTLAAWGNASGKWAASASPALIPFDPSPTPLLTPGGPGTADYDGVREAQLFIDNDSAQTWWLLYDAGDGVTGWREFLASSTDKGKTWKKQGALPNGLSNGASGNYSAVANGWLEKRAGTYYLHRVTAAANFAFPDVGLPGSPYSGDLWSASSLGGPWTFVRSYSDPGFDLLPGSVVLDSGTYYLVSQHSNNVGPGVQLQTASAPGGPYTLDSRGMILPPAYFTGRNEENPKVFWHAGLSRYVVLLNLIAADGIHTDANAVVLNPTILDWPSPSGFVTQNSNGASDAAYSIGVACHVTGPDGALVASPDGYVPITFDGDPRPAPDGQTPNHRGRVIKHAVLEPCAGVATFSDATNANYNLTQAVAHSDFVAEFAVRFANNTVNTNLGFWYRQDSGYQNGYRCVIRNGEPIFLQKVIGGTVSTVVVATNSVGAALPGAPYENRIRIVVNGTRHQVYQDGRLICDVQDASFATGTNIAFSGFACNGAEVRGFRMYKARPVTVNGLANGRVVTLRGAGGLPYTSATVTGGAAQVANAHYPLHGLDADGIPAATDDGSLIWGGDVFTASVPAASSGSGTPAATLNASGSVSLSWGADPLAAYYKVERSVKDGSYRVVPDYGDAFTVLGTLPATMNSFIDYSPSGLGSMEKFKKANGIK